MSNNTQAVATRADKDMEFVPFGAKDKIKLSCAIIRQYIATPTKQGDLPDDRECTRFMMMCRSRLLDPFVGDAFLIGYRNTTTGKVDWSLITAHQAFIKRAEPHPEYNGKRSGVIFSPPLECKTCDGKGWIEIEDNLRPCPKCECRGEWDEIEGDFLPAEIQGQAVTLVGGWCRVFFRTRANPEYQRLKLATYMKSYSPNWRDDPGGMICKCAEAAALRGAFPTSLGGLYMQDERQAFVEAPPVNRPIFGQSDPPALDIAPAKALPEAPAAPPASPEPPPKVETPPPAPASPKPKAAKSKPSVGTLEHLTVLMQASGRTPTEVLDFLKAIGSASSEINTLQELVIVQPEIIKMTCEQWDDIQGKMANS